MYPWARHASRAAAYRWFAQSSTQPTVLILILWSFHHEFVSFVLDHFGLNRFPSFIFHFHQNNLFRIIKEINICILEAAERVAKSVWQPHLKHARSSWRPVLIPCTQAVWIVVVCVCVCFGWPSPLSSSPSVSPRAAKTRLRWTRQIWKTWRKLKRRRREKMKTAKVGLSAVQISDGVIASNV